MEWLEVFVYRTFKSLLLLTSIVAVLDIIYLVYHVVRFGQSPSFKTMNAVNRVATVFVFFPFTVVITIAQVFRTYNRNQPLFDQLLLAFSMYFNNEIAPVDTTADSLFTPMKGGFVIKGHTRFHDLLNDIRGGRMDKAKAQSIRLIDLLIIANPFSSLNNLFYHDFVLSNVRLYDGIQLIYFLRGNKNLYIPTLLYLLASPYFIYLYILFVIKNLFINTVVSELSTLCNPYVRFTTIRRT